MRVPPPSNEVVKEGQVSARIIGQNDSSDGVILNKKEKRIAIFCVTVTSMFWLSFGSTYFIFKYFEERNMELVLCFNNEKCAVDLIKALREGVKKTARGGP